MNRPLNRNVGNRPGQTPRTGRTKPVETISCELPSSVADASGAVVEAGEAPSASAFIGAAVRERLRERRRQRAYAAYAEASRDCAFVAEIAQMERAYDATIGDGLTARE